MSNSCSTLFDISTVPKNIMTNSPRQVCIAPGDVRNLSPATVTPEFVVGINYPWVRCGHDFGPSIYGGRAVNWAPHLQRFRELRAMGIKVIRWWILGNGVNYPPSARDRDAMFEVRELERVDARGLVIPTLPLFDSVPAWKHLYPRDGVELPRLSSSFLHDFEQLCSHCRDADILLIPSLLSFAWFLPIIPRQLASGRYGRGRAPLLFHAAGSRPRRLEEFVDKTLVPLLRASENWRDTIYAWEVLNEPDWSVDGGPVLTETEYGGGVPSLGDLVQRITRPDEMCDLLEISLDLIQDAQFLATIGFKEENPSWLRPSFRSRLQRDAGRRTYVHQLHHYPTTIDDWELPDHATLPIKPCIVGEFPSGQAATAANARWDDDGLAEDDENSYLRRRLELIERKRYPMALIWSATHNPRDPRSQWTANQQRQVRQFSGRD